jgi:hypothetical protein
MMRKLGVAVVLVALAIGARARAQDAAAAGALFDRGLADMQANRFATACPALDESYRLDSRPGTLFTLAECEAKWGHVASAVTHYADYLTRYEQMPADQKARQHEREQIAQRQLVTLKPKVPLLTIRLVGSMPPGMTVSRDGHELGKASLGSGIPIDPGDHVIDCVLASGEKREVKVSIALGEQKTIDIEPPTPVQETTTVVGTDARVVIVGNESRSHLGWTLATAGVALAALATGTITGAMALGDKSVVDANCVGTVCNATGLSAVDSGRTLGLVSTIGFITGAVLVVGVVILAVTEPKKHRSAISFTGWGLTW